MIRRLISVIKEKNRLKYLLSRKFEDSKHQKESSYFNLFVIALENNDDPLAGNCCHHVTNVKQERQCTYNATLRLVRVSIIAV